MQTLPMTEFCEQSQEIAKNLVTNISRLEKVDLYNLLEILISEKAGYPIPLSNVDDLPSTYLTLIKNLFNELEEEERLGFLQWLFNFANPLGLDPKIEVKKLDDFVEFELPRHLTYLGIKAEPVGSVLAQIDKIAKCLNGYRNEIGKLHNAIDRAVSNLTLISQTEDMIQSGSWSSGKAGCLSVLVCRLAVESRDRLRQSQGKTEYRHDDF